MSLLFQSHSQRRTQAFTTVSEVMPLLMYPSPRRPSESMSTHLWLFWEVQAASGDTVCLSSLSSRSFVFLMQHISSHSACQILWFLSHHRHLLPQTCRRSQIDCSKPRICTRLHQSKGVKIIPQSYLHCNVRGAHRCRRRLIQSFRVLWCVLVCP